MYKQKTFEIGEYSIYPKMVVKETRIGYQVECYSYPHEWIQSALFQEIKELHDWLYNEVTTPYFADKIINFLSGKEGTQWTI